MNASGSQLPPLTSAAVGMGAVCAPIGTVVKVWLPLGRVRKYWSML